MAAPTLRIPISANLDGFRQEMDKAVTATSSTVGKIGAEFLKLNSQYAPKIVETVGKGLLDVNTLLSKEGIKIAATSTKIAAQVAAPWAIALGKLAAPSLLKGAGIFAFFAAASGAIHEARRQLEEMVEVANKAGQVNVGGSFFQQFTAAAKNLKIEAKDLEDALGHAFQATKEKLDQLNPTLKKLEEFFLAGFFSEGDKRTGLELFRNADSQEKFIIAVLTSMTELEAIGKSVAALDLAEGFFGPKFADNIRLGKTSATEILATMEKAKKTNIFSDEDVKRAKDIDDRLKKAHQTLEENLRPAWEGLASVALGIKTIWTNIIEIMAEGARLAGEIGSKAGERAIQARELAEIDAQLASGKTRLGFSFKEVPKAEEQLRARRTVILQNQLRLEDRGESVSGQFPGVAPPIKLPRERPSGAPKPVVAAAREDPLESSADRILKRAAALEAEAENIDKGTEARERARIAAELTAVAIQANTKAGLENTEVQKGQQQVIDEVSEAWGKAALKMEQANAPLRSFAREAANVNKQLQEATVAGLRGFEDGFIDIINGTKSVKEAFTDMAKSILNDLTRIAIRSAITGPIASALGAGFFPGRMAGGPVSGGSPYWVGEAGPELFVPSAAGQIIPNNMAMKGGSAPTVTVISHNSFATGVTPTDMAAISQMVDQKDAQNRQAVIGDIRRGNSNDSNFLG